MWEGRSTGLDRRSHTPKVVGSSPTPPTKKQEKKMAIKVRIPSQLKSLTKNSKEIVLEASNILELIDNMENDFPGIKKRLMDNEGKIRRFINVFVNDEDIRFEDNLKTKIKDGDTVSIVPAISGG